MRTLRLSLVGAVIVVLVGLLCGTGGSVVLAQHDDEGVTEETPLEVMSLPGVMADRPERIGSGAFAFVPGVGAVIAAADPVPEATMTIAHPAVEPAVSRRFYPHADERFPSWPEVPGTGGVADRATSEPPPTTTPSGSTPSATVSPAPPSASQVPRPTPTPGPPGFSLAESGEYAVGFRAFEAEDPDRAGREVVITIWYPALVVPGKNPALPMRRAEPDPDGAPYPLILSSTKVAYILAPYLVSRGFVWASVETETYDRMNEAMIDQPLDILFALDTVASRPPLGFEGLIDAEHAGAIGYSFDGYNTLALSGARVDPAYYLAQCPTPDATTEAILSGLSAFSCDPAEAWDAFAAHAGEADTSSEDGLWRPMTDERIRAVMPLAAEGWWLFGDRGLAAVDRPTLMIVATDDALYSENVLIFEHLGTPDRTFISFLGRDHMMITDPAMVARMAHFAAAFFGHRLQGRDDLARFYSQEFVAGHEELSWGAVPHD